MSQVFYEKIVGLLLAFLVLILLIAIASLWLIFYVVFNHIIFYLVHFGMVFLAIFYGIKCYGKFRHFKENLQLFIPKTNNQNAEKHKLEPELKMKLDQTCLDVCLKYRNGMTFRAIGTFYDNMEPESVRHRLKKGLGILLKEYGKTHKH